MEASRLPSDLAEVITGLDLNRYLVMIVIMLALGGLGCLMESLGIMFLTVPVLYPLVTALGFDPIWFGIVMVLLIEFGLITPPVGLNVFVLVSLVREIKMRDAFIGIWPFLVAMIALAALLLAFPQIALFLPQRMGP
jgi:TRAP-type C4-dicarboxylate transport system permease large subunit